uniref:Uncharacterized protein n=1 Tax=Glossina brevipalpis TaxID=37001 RepID=A0A1A9X1D5_9MUSC
MPIKCECFDTQFKLSIPYVRPCSVRNNMSALVQNLKVLIIKYPVIRGMVSYSCIWPTSSLIQQTIEGKTWENYDWWRVLRFSLYGGFFVAPTLYSWIKVSSAMWPQTTLATALSKAAVETVSYTPAAMTCFYFIMSLLELKTIAYMKHLEHHQIDEEGNFPLISQ